MLLKAYRRASQTVSSVARDYNLIAVDEGVLTGLQGAASSDQHAADYVTRLTTLLDKYTASLDVVVSSDILSLYGEALVYWLLVERVKIKPIAAGPNAAPDFEVMSHSGKVFFLEVKTLEYAGGTSAQKTLQAQAMDKQIEAEERATKAPPGPRGTKVGMTEQEISPLGQYIGGSRFRYEIKELIHRLHSRFKGSQFSAGPTFAVAPLVRLLPAKMRAVDALDLLAMYPYFRAPLDLGSDQLNHVLSARAPVIPGRLWNIAFAEPGTLIPDVPDSEGSTRLPEPSRLDDFGLLVPHGSRYIGAAGLLFIGPYSSDVPFGTNIKEHVLLGLFDAKYTASGWDDLASEEAMHAMGVIWNDAGDGRGRFYM